MVRIEIQIKRKGFKLKVKGDFFDPSLAKDFVETVMGKDYSTLKSASTQED